MATMARLLGQKDKIVDRVFTEINEAEENREREFRAAVLIQSWFRALQIRVYLKFLNTSAIEIQRTWRGYVGRKRYRSLLKEKVFQMKLNQYNALAKKIQKVWRGYYTRKYISNYYSRKRYLMGLQIKNEIVRNELEEYAEQLELRTQWERESEEKRKLDLYTAKHHYLLSTEVKPGIYNSPFKPYPDEMEFHLRKAKPLDHSKERVNAKFDPAWKSYDAPRPDPLPPIDTKPQGPFRDPCEVQLQRYKPFQPTLRVATSYKSVEDAREKMKQEEWITRINDNIFVPFSKKGQRYDPLLHTTSKYGHLSYGTKFFRHEYPDKFIIPKSFQTVVPPIPILEKLNDTYSQGQV